MTSSSAKLSQSFGTMHLTSGIVFCYRVFIKSSFGYSGPVHSGHLSSFEHNHMPNLNSSETSKEKISHNSLDVQHESPKEDCSPGKEF
jgi:hypothetical protein